MTPRRIIAVFALAALSASTIAFSGASFSSQSTNPNNGFSAKADWVAPTSSASSPASQSSTTISVTYTSGDAGTGVASVELFVKRPGDSGYSSAGVDNTPASASFSYTAAAGFGSYSFYTRATDSAGNVEAAPGTADTTTELVAGGDTTKPTSSVNAMSQYKNTSTLTVEYTASDNPGGSDLGSVELWVKDPDDAAYRLATTDTTPGTQTVDFTADAGVDGTYLFYTRAIDLAGNHEDAPASPPDAQTFVDRVNPSSAVTGPTTTQTTSPFSVLYSQSDSGGSASSGVTSVELWVKDPGGSSYALNTTDTSVDGTVSFTSTDSCVDGGYDFYTRAVDAAGNREAVPGTPPDRTITQDRTPSATDLQGANGGTAATMDGGDTLTLSFSERLKTSSVLSTWTDAATSPAVSVTVGNNSNNDTLTVTGTTIGTIALKANWVSANVTFGSSTLSRSGCDLVLTLGGNPASGRNTGVAAARMSYTVPTAFKDEQNNSMSNTGGGGLNEAGGNPGDVDF